MNYSIKELMQMFEEIGKNQRERAGLPEPVLIREPAIVKIILDCELARIRRNLNATLKLQTKLRLQGKL